MFGCEKLCPFRDTGECMAVTKTDKGILVTMFWECDVIQRDLEKWERISKLGSKNLRPGGATANYEEYEDVFYRLR